MAMEDLRPQTPEPTFADLYEPQDQQAPEPKPDAADKPQDNPKPPDNPPVVPPDKVDAPKAAKEPEFVRLTAKDVPAEALGGKKYALFVVDPDADPAASIIEPGTNKRLRLATREENAARVDRQSRGEGGDTRPFQKEAIPGPPPGPTLALDVATLRTQQFERVQRLVSENKVDATLGKALQELITKAPDQKEFDRINDLVKRFDPSVTDAEAERQRLELLQRLEEKNNRVKKIDKYQEKHREDKEKSKPENVDQSKWEYHEEFLGRGTGFGEPRIAFYTHPDVLNPDGTPRRFAGKEVERFKAGPKHGPGDTVRPDVRPERDRFAPPELPRGMKAKTLDEIQGDPQTQMLFNVLLENLDGTNGGKYQEIYARALQRELLTPQEKRIMTFARHELALRMPMGERLRGGVNAQDIEIGKKRDAAFRDDVELKGTTYTENVIKDQALVLAMKLPRAEVQKYVHAVDVLESNRNTRTYRRWEQGTKDLMARTKTDFEDYEKTFKVETKAERIETRGRVRDLIRGEWGRVHRALDAVMPWGFSSSTRADTLVRKADSLQRKFNKNATLKQVSGALDSMTKFMALSLSHDPEVQLALQQGGFRAEDMIALRQKPPTFKEIQSGIPSLRQQVTGGTEGLKRDWEAHKRTIPDWNTKSDFERGGLRDDWMSSRMPADAGRAEKGGIFSFLKNVLAAIAGALFGKQRDALSIDKIS